MVVAWYRFAARYGHVDAMLAMAGACKEFVERTAWLEMAADHGSSSACIEFAKDLVNQGDRERAWRYYKRAGELGSLSAYASEMELARTYFA